MPRIIDTMRLQNAIYWPRVGVDGAGRNRFGTLVELVDVGCGNYRVRWRDTKEEFRDGEGVRRISRAKVHVPQLEDGSELTEGGFLWLGIKDDLTDESDPRKNKHAFEIRRFDKTPTRRADQFLRTAWL